MLPVLLVLLVSSIQSPLSNLHLLQISGGLEAIRVNLTRWTPSLF